MVTTILGPILPHLSARWSLSDAQAGFFFTAQFLGSLSGVGLFSLASRRQSLRTILLAGYLLMIAGVVLLGSAAHALALFGTFLAGISLGLVITASNLQVATAPLARRAAILSLLNVAWGVGAVLCPFLVAMTAPRIGLRSFLLLMAGALAVFLLALAASPVPLAAAVASAKSPAAGHAASASGFAALATLALLFFLYVGTENSLGGWAASFAKRLQSGHLHLAQLAPAFFWGTLLLGRIAAPVLLRRISERRIALASMTLIFLSSLFLLLASTLALALTGIALAGLGCAAIYPILVTWLTTLPGVAQSGLRGIPFACATLGGATLPWMVGAVSTRFGGLQKGLLVVALASTLLLVGSRIFQRQTALAPIPGNSGDTA